jgi:hypothetical protein
MIIRRNTLFGYPSAAPARRSTFHKNDGVAMNEEGLGSSVLVKTTRVQIIISSLGPIGPMWRQRANDSFVCGGATFD